MRIIGNGMIARSFLTVDSTLYPQVAVLASGVSNSLCDLDVEFEREVSLLKKTLLECRQKSETIVYFSSAGAVYKRSNEVKGEDYPTLPDTRYGQHKLFCETIIRDSGVRHIIARLPNVVGHTKNNRQLVPYFIACAKSGYVRIYKEARRDIIDVEDMTKIVCDILKSSPERLTINLASGFSIPVIEIFDEIKRSLDLDPRVELLEGGNAQVFDVSLMLQYVQKPLFFDNVYYKRVIGKYIGC